MNPPRNILGLKRPNSIMDINVIENDITSIKKKINEIEIKINEIKKNIKVDQSNERLQLLLLEKEKQLTITTERLYEKEKLLREEQKLAYELGKYYGDQLVLRNCSKSNQLVLFITADIVVNSCYS